MTAFSLATTIVQNLAIFAAVLAAMIMFGRRRPPVPLQAMNDGGLDTLLGTPQTELKTFTARDGSALAYREFSAGSDQVAILIHGSSADGRAMQAIGHSLASQAISAYALDMRGHGGSGRRGDIDYVGQLEDDLFDFVQHIRIRHPMATFSLVGH